jgi:hypothetical protein
VTQGSSGQMGQREQFAVRVRYVLVSPRLPSATGLFPSSNRQLLWRLEKISASVFTRNE